jgi:hypothetical protein
MDVRSAGEAERRSGVIELKLRDPAQLFDTLDPSPFHERDLDPKAEDFIVGWAGEYPRGVVLELIVHLSEVPRDPELASAVESAVRAYFYERVQTTGRELRTLLSIGRTSLVIGLAFLAFCVLASRLLHGLGDQPVYRVPAFGFEIAGWVAMWRPLEILLYDWWPILRRRRLYARLSRMRVSLRAPAKEGRAPA